VPTVGVWVKWDPGYVDFRGPRISKVAARTRISSLKFYPSRTLRKISGLGIFVVRQKY
jgi:hypothetical protein